MIRNSIKVIAGCLPSIKNCGVDDAKNLIRGCRCKSLCCLGNGHILVVKQSGGTITGESGIDIFVHVLIVSQAQTVAQKGIHVSAGHVSALHIDPKYTGTNTNKMGFPKVFAEVGLYQRNAINCARLDHTVTGSAGNTIANIHSRNKLCPTAANADRDVAGVSVRCQRGSNQHIPLFKFGLKESLTGSDTGGIHCERFGLSATNGTKIESSHILISHDLTSLSLSQFMREGWS